MEKEIIIVLILGGLASLDLTEAFQSMWSQPLVSGPLLGWLWGNWQDGLLIGVLLQLLWLWYVPLGIAVFPDAAVGGIVGAATFLSLKSWLIFDFHKVTLLVLLFSLIWSYVSGWVAVKNRNWNVRLVKQVEKGLMEGKDKLDLYFALALLVSFFRGAVTAVVGFVVVKVTVEIFANRIAFIPDDLFDFVLPALYGFGVASLFLFFGKPRNWLFILGGTVLGGVILWA
jgi:mannose/fructose/N-acetylgalactosamine-specific phosphotransferase system component IIC